jgi:thiol-disulfide isomerase/thioredoxin
MLSKQLKWMNWCAAGALLLGMAFSTYAHTLPRPLIDVSLDAPGGKRVRLLDYKGKAMLIAIMSTQCERCQESIPMLNEFQRIYGPQGVQIVAAVVNEDAVKDLRGFIDRFQPRFPIGVLSQDNTRRLADFGPKERPFVPMFLFVNKHGVLKYQFSGDDSYFKSEKSNTKNVLDVLLKQ